MLTVRECVVGQLQRKRVGNECQLQGEGWGMSVNYKGRVENDQHTDTTSKDMFK